VLPTQAGNWSLRQFVGNSADLAANKKKRSGPSDVWEPDISIGGRVVGIHRLDDGADCDTYVQSGGAGVHTLVVHTGSPHPPSDEICARAIAFTRATIAEMPR